jgi:cell division protease FtsH
MEIIAKGTPGFSGADLENLVNEAALHAAKQNKEQVTMEDFEGAKDKVLMGSERRSLILSEEEKKTTAYHEAGHTIVAKILPGTDPIHKVSIIPRGRALGVTMQLPQDERHNYSKTYLENNLAVLLGGRVAEELVFNQMTTGAGNDIERATKMARKMVCEWGMSETIGPLAFGGKGEEVFLGREFTQHKEYSEETARLIDEEVKKIVRDAYEKAKNLVQENIESLHNLAEALLERETLTGVEVEMVMKGQDLPSLEEKMRSDRQSHDSRKTEPVKPDQEKSDHEGFKIEE